jgi:prepilin-type N-terminal cleavage/methylation domain-containing protein
MLTSRNNKEIRGFTLIELLVVISIIGLLSAVVLAALNTARAKGTDASIKANLDSIRNQAAIYYDNNGNYTTISAADNGSCATASTLFQNDANIKAAITAVSNSATVTCNQDTQANGGGWVIYAPLKGGNGWCVDWKNNSKIDSAGAPGSGVFLCP